MADWVDCSTSSMYAKANRSRDWYYYMAAGMGEGQGDQVTGGYKGNTL